MAILLSCQAIAKSYHHRPLFEGLSLTLGDRERLGIIGPNGAGKSTFLRLAAGLEAPDAGEITTKRGLRLAYVPQVASFPKDATALAILTQAASSSLSASADAHDAGTQASILLSQIGCLPDAVVGSLSGGWQKRLLIASALVTNPDLVLFDEPTNHLDLAGIVWLETLLKSAPFAWALVSHDRYLLNRVTTRIVEISTIYSGGAFASDGNYDAFLAKRATYLAQQQRLGETLANKARRETEWLRRGPPARTTKSQSRIDEAHALIRELAETKARLKQQDGAKIDFAATGRKTKRLIVGEGLCKTLGGRPVLQDLSFVLTPGVALGVLGANGAGKTTLLRLLNGDLTPDGGTLTRADGLRVVYFDQSRSQLDLAQTLKDYWAGGSDSVVYRGSTQHAASWARRFQFRPEQLDLTLGDLSGGEQARALVAKLMLTPADVLLLDEPTNDLDIQTIEMLEDSLQEFPGAIVLVSHDRYFMDQVASLVLGLSGQGPAQLYADYAQWEKATAREASRPVVGDKPATAAAEPSAVAKPQAKRLSYLEQREFDSLEARITAAELQVNTCRAASEDPRIAANATELTRACDDLAKAETEVANLYERWAELEAKIR